MVQSSLATKSHSFELVKGEIESTIKQAEQSLERFQENRESGEDLQNCVDFINQLRGIFILVELRGGMLLCQESVSLANEVPVGATDDKNNLLTALSNALFILRRYVEYYHRQRADHPELLLPIINELREARKEKPYPDSCFFEVDARKRPDFCAGLDVRPLVLENEADYEIHARRIRLMYQVGLLGVLRDRDPLVSQKLIGRAAESFSRLCNGAPMGQIWCLLHIVMATMQDRLMGFEKPRKRLLMRLEKYAREIVYVGRVAMTKEAPDSLFRELVYILYQSGSHNPEVMQILSAYDLAPAEFNEAMVLAHRKRLYGPGSDVLKSLSEALLEEINQLKDKVDIIERGIEPDISELGNIAVSLERLANTLLILDLNQLSELAKREAALLRQWEQDGHLPEEDSLYALADAVLNIEEAAQQLVNKGITEETDSLAGEARRSEQSLYLREAVIVVADEAKSALTLAKRAITAFLESDFDKMHLANVPATLRSIWGGLMMMEDAQAATLIARIATGIDERLLAAKGAPENRVLEALADALTSLEYYIEGLGANSELNPDLLKLAETSLGDVGL
ncbi:chemotaxis protein [Mangrovitalea sediminis]|uniref:chemotaxis protein n=1 Tax=Mangrovitalea sediminis TaxID=1982043 RepID=UPI000BE4D23D|nr:chemotaxis protein [Mangrovitalea sediminis]